MQQYFTKAHERRRKREFVFTSGGLNAVWYGSPAWARKKDIWPPLSKVVGFDDEEGVLDGQTLGKMELGDEPGRASGNVVASDEDIAQKGALDKPLEGTLTHSEEYENELYHPLRQGRIIRVLAIHPGKQADPILCSFHYIDLSAQHLSFEALSYVWGDPSLHRSNDLKPSVTCNGHEKIVTANLWNALRHIRSPVETKRLWADALCINQDDNDERSHQVTLMSMIYSAAQTVIIWIGEQKYMTSYVDERKGRLAQYPSGFEDVRAQRAFGAVCEVVNQWQQGSGRPDASFSTCSPDDADQRITLTNFREKPIAAERCEDPGAMESVLAHHFDLGEPDEQPEQDLGLVSSPETAKHSQFWLSLEDLFDRSWFWRVWTIQEAVLARRAIVKWNNVEIDWRWIGTAAAILRTTYRRICDEMQISGVYNAYLLFRMSKLSDLPLPELSFIQFLRLTRQFEVTDPRDRVYGLLGMKMADNDPVKGTFFLRPDYSITEAELWTRLAWKAIENQDSLSILSSVQYTTNAYDSGLESEFHTFDLGLDKIPSWVPHWQTAYRSTLAAWDLQESFSASRGLISKPALLKEPESTILRVEGIKIGDVGLAGYYMWRDVDTSFLLRRIGKFFATESGLALLAKTYTAGRNEYGSLSDQTSMQALHGLAAYILMLHSKRDTTTGFQGYEELDFAGRRGVPRKSKNFQLIFDRHIGLKERLETLVKSGDAEMFRAIAVATCERRRLFITMNGLLGLGPDNLLEGDILVVLAGSDVPFLLRPVRNDKEVETGEISHPATSSPQQYLLVGECYVEGLMNGQAVAAVESGLPLIGSIPAKTVFEEVTNPTKIPSVPLEDTESSLSKSNEDHGKLEDFETDRTASQRKGHFGEREEINMSAPILETFDIQ